MNSRCLFLEDTNQFARSSSSASEDALPSDSSRGVHQRSPLHRVSPPCQLPKRRNASSAGAATHPTCSALVVPPDLSGLLHGGPCRFVAPCCRPWGSLGFSLRAVRRWRGASSPAHTLRSFSLTGSCHRAPTEVDAWRIPSRRYDPKRVVITQARLPLRRAARPQGFAPPESPLQPLKRCRSRAPDAPLGF